MSTDLDIKTAIMAVGRARVRYHGTENWLYIGHDSYVDDNGNQIASVFCPSLGYPDGQVSLWVSVEEEGGKSSISESGAKPGFSEKKGVITDRRKPTKAKGWAWTRFW